MTRVLLILLSLVSVAQGLTTITVNPGGGADYTSLAAAEAALPDPLTDNYQINCSGATDDTGQTTVNVVTLNGATQYTLTISGDNTTGIFDDSKYHIALGNGYYSGILIETNYVTIERMQITGRTVLTKSADGIVIMTGHTNITLRNNLIQDFTTPGDGFGILFYQAGANCYAINNVLWNCLYGIGHWDSLGTLYNNTCPNSTYGIYVYETANTNAVIKNNLLDGSATADYYVQVGASGIKTTAKNYTGDATSPDAGCASATITFVGGEDFHLDSSMEMTLKGSDLSGTFTTDIDAETRAWWYAGADEIPWSGSMMLLMHHKKRSY